MKLTQKIINILPRDHFKGMDLSYANFEGLKLWDFDFSGCNLTGANLKGVYLWSVNLYLANLEGANLINASLYGANLQDVNLTGTDLRNCRINQYTQGISEELINKFNIIKFQ